MTEEEDKKEEVHPKDKKRHTENSDHGDVVYDVPCGGCEKS